MNDICVLSAKIEFFRGAYLNFNPQMNDICVLSAKIEFFRGAYLNFNPQMNDICVLSAKIEFFRINLLVYKAPLFFLSASFSVKWTLRVRANGGSL